MLKGNLNVAKRPEVRLKISKANKGKKRSEEMKEQHRKMWTGKGNPKYKKGHLICGKNNPNYGNGIKISGSKNPMWKGGTSFLPYSSKWTTTFKQSIRERDNFQCQLCGIFQSSLNGHHKLLAIHHIDYNKKNCNPNNLTSLCHKCHGKTNHNEKHWITYFKNK